ncbi:MAG: RDD family protein [Acidimicrobiia bacterium]
MSDALPPPPDRADDAGGDERWRYGPPGDTPPGGAGTAAPWWRRAVAFLLDGLVLGAPIALIGFQLDLVRTVETAEFTRYEPESGLLVLQVIAVVIYAAIMDGGPRGATVGKMAMKIQVRDAQTGGPIGPGRAAMRRLIYVALFYAYFLPGAANALSPLWDKRRQAWHDKAVRSIVVNNGA